MAEKTAIQWTDATWNPWRGCTKVTAGCDHCYMFRDQIRYGRDPEVVTRAAPATFNAPLKWERDLVSQARGAAITPRKVFTCSWSDWFHPHADEWRPEAWNIIRQTPHLTYQILTKRPNRIKHTLPADWGKGYPNVWLGATVESEGQDWRVQYLREVPAAVRFVSYEPGIDRLVTAYTQSARFDGVDWLIIGGESGGREARPFRLDWARGAVRYCRDVGIAPFVKQLGTVWAREHKAKDWHGGDWSEWPEDLRVREFPTVTTPALIA
jgi:protein gp37